MKVSRHIVDVVLAVALGVATSRTAAAQGPATEPNPEPSERPAPAPSDGRQATAPIGERVAATPATSPEPVPSPTTSPSPLRLPPTPAPVSPWWQSKRPPAPPGEHVDPDSEERARHPAMTAWALGVWGGVGGFKGAAQDRAAVASTGVTLGLSLTMTLWDHLPIASSFSGLILRDRMPFHERVMDCTTVYCGDPYDADSDVEASLLSLETGYQHRFWWSYSTSLIPSVFLGHAWDVFGLSHSVRCDGCKSVEIHGVHAGGVYVGPSLKISVTMGQNGMVALGLRSEFFLTGDIANRTILGFEFGSQ